MGTMFEWTEFGNFFSDIQYEWKDITEIFELATEELEASELIASEDFSYKNAMTAVIIGHPKLDVVKPGYNLMTAEELIEAGKAPVEGIAKAQLIGIMDKLLTLEASFHQGTGLGVSVYTCLYMFQLDRLKCCPPLSVYCKLTRAICSTVRSIILRAKICEDTEFNPLTHNIPLDEGYGDENENPLEEAVILIKKMEKQMKSKTIERNEIELKEDMAILTRIKFLKSFLAGLEHLLQKELEHIGTASILFKMCLNELEIIKLTQKYSNDEFKGFEPDLDITGSRLRYVKLFDKEETYQHFKKLLEELFYLTEIKNIENYFDLKRFLVDWSKKFPMPLTRSIAFLQFYEAEDYDDCANWVVSPKMIAEIFGIFDIKSLDSTKCKSFIEFLGQATIGVQNWVACMCYNHPLMHRRIKDAFVDWNNLYDYAYLVDTSKDIQNILQFNQHIPKSNSPHPGICTMWVVKECCENMICYMSMGFELNLYREYDFLFTYWYCEYVAQHLVQNARSIYYGVESTVNKLKEAITEENKKIKKGKGKKSQKKKMATSSAVRTSDNNTLLKDIDNSKFKIDYAISQARKEVFGAFTRMFIGFRYGDGFQPKQAYYSKEYIKFYQRFKSFWSVQHPMPVDYRGFRESIKADMDMSTIFIQAALSFKAAKDCSDYAYNCMINIENVYESELEELRSFSKICHVNFVACKVLSQMCQTMTTPIVQVKNDIHLMFPIIKVSST